MLRPDGLGAVVAVSVSGFPLEDTTPPGSGHWATEHTVTVPANAERRFYRLKKSVGGFPVIAPPVSRLLLMNTASARGRGETRNRNNAMSKTILTGLRASLIAATIEMLQARNALLP